MFCASNLFQLGRHAKRRCQGRREIGRKRFAFRLTFSLNSGLKRQSRAMLPRDVLHGRRLRSCRLGHRTVLLTGALDFVIEPLRPLFDDVVSATLDERDGRLTGELISVPPTGEARALLLAGYAEANDLSLSDAVAYADSASDLPMLESVGFPVAVNPEPKLATIARRRGWHVEHWSKAPGGPRPLLPMGARP